MSSDLDKLPKKGLKLAHINICSLGNKFHEMSNLLILENMNTFAISETYLDHTFDDMAVRIQGYTVTSIEKTGMSTGEVLLCPLRSKVFLYLYYLLHCGIILKTSKLLNNTYGII